MLCKIIHAYLSDYNIIITPNEDFLLIDFPQYEPITHKNRDELLFRDMSNICQFFKRKYRFQADPKDICETIIAEYMKRAKKFRNLLMKLFRPKKRRSNHILFL